MYIGGWVTATCHVGKGGLGQAVIVGGGGEWRGEEGARRPGPKGQFLYHVLRHALRNALRNALRRVLDVLVLHVSPKESVGGGGRWRVPQ